MNELLGAKPTLCFLLIVLMIPLVTFGGETNTASESIRWPTSGDRGTPPGMAWGGLSNRTLHRDLAAESRTKNGAGSILEYKSTTLWSTVLDFAFYEEYIIALSINGLQVFAQNDRDTPIAHLPIPMGALTDQFELRDNLLCVCRANELHIVDITDVLAPVTISIVTFDLWVRDVVIEADRLYIGLFTSTVTSPLPTFHVYDISNPSAPSLIGTLVDNDSYADSWDIIVVDSFAYTIGNGFITNDLKVISLVDETNPTRVSTVDLGSPAFAMVHRGDFIYVVRDDGIAVYDISSPASPQQVNLVANADGNWACLLRGNHLFVRTYNGVRVYDIAQAALPVLINTFGADPPWWDVWHGMEVDGSHLYLPQYINGFHVYDIAYPYSVWLVEDYKCPSWASSGLAVGEQFCYVTHMGVGGGWGDSLHIIDMSDLGDPQLSSNLLANPQTPRATLSGDKLSVSMGGSGMKLYDLSDPSQPTLTHIDRLGKWAEHTFMTPDLAFVSGQGLDFYIFDISDVFSPQFLGSAYVNRMSWASVVENDLVFVLEAVHVEPQRSVITYQTNLRVFDAADPTQPQTLGDVLVGVSETRPEIITKVGSYVYVAQSDSILIIFDVSDPAQPFIAADYLLMGSGIFDLCRFGSYLFVSIADPPVVEILNVSSPLTPVSVEYALYPSPVKEIHVDGDHLYAATENGFYIHTISFTKICGDIDFSGADPDISDLVYLVDFMFNGGPEPPYPQLGDVDGSGGQIDIADLVYFVDFMFNGGPAPICL